MAEFESVRIIIIYEFYLPGASFDPNPMHILCSTRRLGLEIRERNEEKRKSEKKRKEKKKHAAK